MRWRLGSTGMALLLCQCNADTPSARESTPAPESTMAKPVVAPAEHVIAGYRVGLMAEGERCRVTYRPVTKADGTPEELPLVMSPPCHWMIRPTPPVEPGANADSDGVPVGGQGELLAWRYPSAGNVTVAMVIGELPHEPDPAQLVAAKKAKCGAKAQALLLSPSGVRLSKRVSEHVRCAEGGDDEKSFWLFAHDG